MKALSILQPWAWAILYAGKRVENRTWRIHHRGEFLIHASKGWDKEGAEYLCAPSVIDQAVPHKSEMPRGAIVGRARIIDCVSDFGFDDIREHGDPWYQAQGVWVAGPWCAILADVVPCDPVPCSGALGFWTVPDDVLAQVRFPACRERPAESAPAAPEVAP